MISFFRNFTSKAEDLTLERFLELTHSQQIADIASKLSTLEGEEYSRLKRKLPAITWQSHFEVGASRSNENAQPNGLFIMDFDHINQGPLFSVFDFYNNILTKIKDTEWADRIYVAHQTPSCDGLRLVIASLPKYKSIEENQKAFADAIQMKYDEACHDLARLSFVVPHTYFYFTNNKVFDYEQVNNFKDSVGAGVSAHRPSADKKAEKEGEQAGGGEERRREEILNAKFRGASYRDIVNALVQKIGGVPQRGERNVRLFYVARKLRYIVDFDAERLALILPDFGLSKEEVNQVAQSAVKGSRTSKIPYDLWKIIEQQAGASDANSDDEDSEEEKTEIPPMPPVFDELTKIAPASFQKPVVFALLPILGTLCSKLRATYIDGALHSPSFMTVIEAPQASGKSFTRNLVNLCLRPVFDKDKEALIKEHEYAKLLRKLKNAKDQPDEPQCIVRAIPATVSIAKLLKRLDNADGLHLFSFVEEIDTMTKSNAAGAWSQKSDIYRNAFDNSVFGQDYMSDNSYSANLEVYYNLLMCGTPNAVSRFFKDPEDGLVSRVIFTSLEDQFACKLPVWRKLTAKQTDRLTKICSDLEKTFCINDNGDVVNTTEIDISYVKKDINKWLEKQRLIALRSDDKARDIFRRRSAVIAFRAAMISAALCKMLNKKNTEKLTKTFAIFVADNILNMQLDRYGQELGDISVTHNSKARAVSLYDAIPDTFTRSELLNLLMLEGKKTPPKSIIYNWTKNGLIEKCPNNTFKKLKK